jgi:hypothetical protein
MKPFVAISRPFFLKKAVALHASMVTVHAVTSLFLFFRPWRSRVPLACLLPCLCLLPRLLLCLLLRLQGMGRGGEGRSVISSRHARRQSSSFVIVIRHQSSVIIIVTVMVMLTTMTMMRNYDYH